MQPAHDKRLVHLPPLWQAPHEAPVPIYVPVLSNPDKSRRLDCGRWRISIKSSPIAWLPRLVGIRPKDSSADRQWVLCPYVWQKYGTLYAVSFHGCVMLLQLVG